MSSWKDALTGDYLKAQDIEGTEPIYTIKGVGEVTFKGDKGADETKPTIQFREIDQHLSLNKTNIKTLMFLFGEDQQACIGKKVQLMVVPTEKGDSVQIKKLKLDAGPVTPRPGGSLKGDAWRVFKDHNAGVAEADLGPKFKAELADLFPGIGLDKLGDEHFQKFIASYNAPAPFKEDDIPF
jgi:hypothetical protein